MKSWISRYFVYIWPVSSLRNGIERIPLSFLYYFLIKVFRPGAGAMSMPLMSFIIYFSCLSKYSFHKLNFFASSGGMQLFQIEVYRVV
jgi:hypothetical protein